MREIKFRAWDNRRKQMILPREKLFYQHFLSFCGQIVQSCSEGMHCLGGEDRWTHQRDLELMQFTGLRDKNGKEIYEGDILVFEDPDNQDGELVKKIDGKGFVQWDDSCHLYRYFVCALFVHCGARPGVSLGDFGDLENIEVIGNIYENPDLNKQPAFDDSLPYFQDD